jgi:predicted nucleic acid-binding protein
LTSTNCVVVVADTSVWIDHLVGNPNPAMDAALLAEAVVFPPLVVSELFAGADTPDRRADVALLLQDFPVHKVGLEHWIALGDLRRELQRQGCNATIPDAHVAQCALELDATLLTGDAIFRLIAEHVPLRLG